MEDCTTAWLRGKSEERMSRGSHSKGAIVIFVVAVIAKV